MVLIEYWSFVNLVSKWWSYNCFSSWKRIWKLWEQFSLHATLIWRKCWPMYKCCRNIQIYMLKYRIMYNVHNSLRLAMLQLFIRSTILVYNSLTCVAKTFSRSLQWAVVGGRAQQWAVSPGNQSKSFELQALKNPCAFCHLIFWLKHCNTYNS